MSEHDPHEPLDPLDPASAHDDGGTPVPGLDASSHAGRRRGSKRRSGCVPILLALVVVAGLGWFGVTKGIEVVSDRFGDPDDFAGPGTGRVTFEVAEGDSISTMGANLEDKGVVASVEAFTDAADGTSIRDGCYLLKNEMKASDAVAALVSAATRSACSFTIFPVKTAEETVRLLAKTSDIPLKDFEKELRNPGRLGIPDDAEGNVEGYLFPGEYPLRADSTARSLLTAMVQRWRDYADEVDLVGGAERLGYTEHELMTVASLVQAEGATLSERQQSMIARVIYNRLENVGTAGTVGRLELDATVAYALGENPGVALTQDQLDVDSPYNTRRVTGLPPGPIDNPGEVAIKAALEPAEGDWYYYVTVNLKTGETKFAETPAEFARYKAEFLTYCETSDAC